jgi:hypothetical protein
VELGSRHVATRIALAGVVCGLASAPLAADAAKSTVKAPKSGTYDGGSEQRKPITLYINGKSIDLVAFSFKCNGTGGRTSLNSIKLVKSSKGYKFSLKAHASITFADEQPDENGKIDIAGIFTRSGKKVVGTFHVKSSRCHTGTVDWRAKR